MTNKKFSDFPNATNANPILFVGLQGGANVQIPASPLARAIQDAFNLNINFVLAGNITAANLSGTNTGDQPPLGLTGVLRPASAVIGHYTANRITAASVALTTPPSPADFEQFIVTVEDASFTGCTIVANGTPSGVTVDGLSTLNIDVVPIALWYQYNLAAKNWFRIGIRT